jgi:hypothetical protein
MLRPPHCVLDCQMLGRKDRYSRGPRLRDLATVAFSRRSARQQWATARLDAAPQACNANRFAYASAAWSAPDGAPWFSASCGLRRHER